MDFEKVQRFLPQYLSENSKRLLFEDVRKFVDGNSGRLFARNQEHLQYLLQGDGVSDLKIISMPTGDQKDGIGMIISNTCDVDPVNTRMFSSSVCYVPVVKFETYLGRLLSRFPRDRVDSHAQEVRRQEVTQLFFLPKGAGLSADHVAFLDRIVSCSSHAIDRSTLPERKLFSMSNFGFYLLLLKISIHFTRVREGIDRN